MDHLGRAETINELADKLLYADKDRIKKAVLEWYAKKLDRMMQETVGESPGAKSYDPLSFESCDDGTYIAHSYAFDMKDGGRHHHGLTFNEVEEYITQETINWIRVDIE